MYPQGVTPSFTRLGGAGIDIQFGDAATGWTRGRGENGRLPKPRRLVVAYVHVAGYDIRGGDAARTVGGESEKERKDERKGMVSHGTLLVRGTMA